jgi:hypothetical protein
VPLRPEPFGEASSSAAVDEEPHSPLTETASRLSRAITACA